MIEPKDTPTIWNIFGWKLYKDDSKTLWLRGIKFSDLPLVIQELFSGSDNGCSYYLKVDIVTR